MKIFKLLLFSALLHASSAFTDDPKENVEGKTDYIQDAEKFLATGKKVKARKAAAKEWLAGVEKDKPALGDRLYYTALAHSLLGQTEQGAEQIFSQLKDGMPLPYHAAVHQSAIARLLPIAMGKALNANNPKAVAAIAQSQLDHTDRTVRAIFQPVSRKIKNLDPSVRQDIRGALLPIISNLTYLRPAEKDQLIASLYGKRTDPGENKDSTSPTTVDGTPFNSPRFLIMGGGGSPSHNQISLEKNVQFLLRVQEGKDISSEHNHILFADGNDEGRDLQLMDIENEPDELHELLAALLASPSAIYHTYRDNELENVAGASTEGNIKKYFEGLSITNNEQLVINFTGHGGRGEKNNTQNTSIYLWEGKSYRVKDFCSVLNKVPAENPVMVLMVQCYSGGFSNIIFKEGNPEKGLADHPRCGFFATVHDRIAAGCTPAVNEADYREYSSYFLAALHGVDRVGREIPSVDYDGDGNVCFAEAHAYSLIASDTLDISVKTTDTFLRKFSAIRDDLLNTRSYNELIRHAGPNERAVLEQLSSDLKLHGDARIETARRVAKDLFDQRKKMGDMRNEIKKANTEMRNTLRKALRARWPELFYPWHPAIERIMEEEAQHVLKTINKHPKGTDYKSNREQYESLSEKYHELEARWAKFQRYIRTAENVAYEVNLPKVAKPDIQKRFAELKALEHGTLGDVSKKTAEKKKTAP